MKMNYASNSATKLASQQSIKAYVDAQTTLQDLDIAPDSGTGQSIDLDSATLTFAGGTEVGTSCFRYYGNFSYHFKCCDSNRFTDINKQDFYGT